MSVSEFFDGWKWYKWILLLLMGVAFFWHCTYAFRILGADKYLLSVPAARPMGEALVNLDDVRRRTGGKFEGWMNEKCKIVFKGGCPKFSSFSRFVMGMGA